MFPCKAACKGTKTFRDLSEVRFYTTCNSEVIRLGATIVKPFRSKIQDGLGSASLWFELPDSVRFETLAAQVENNDTR